MNNTMRTISSIKPTDFNESRQHIVFVIAFVLLFIVALFYLSDQALLEGITTTGAETSEEVLTLTPNQMGEILMRSGIGPNDTSLDILYAPTWYFDWNKRVLPNIEQPALAFFVIQNIHDGELPGDIPLAFLRVGNEQVSPIVAEIVSDAPHHRVIQVLFNLLNDDGQPYITEESAEIVLVTPIDGQISSGNTYRWDLPLPYGLGALNMNGVTGSNHPEFTWTGLLAIMSGMLSALSPCLLQLGMYYTAVLVGAEASLGEQKIKANAARLAVMRTSLFFVVGFTAVYTTGGVLAGYVGQSLEQLNFLQQWYRPVSFVAGVIIIVMAVRVAIKSRVPLVCRLPARIGGNNGRFSSALMGVSFAIGCLSCFSATVLSALLLYAGSTGSPVSGGLLLFLFSSGVGIIFLLAAWMMSYAAPQFTGTLERVRPIIGGLSAAVMIGFGLLMVTYEFHTVSGFLFQLFSS